MFVVNNDSLNNNDIRARKLLQEWFQDHGVNPELHIWPDTESASIEGADKASLYPIVARIINSHGVGSCDVDDQVTVDTALFEQYDHFREVATKQIAEETNENTSVRSGALHTWEGKDGYYYCFSSTNKDGIYSESEDVGPFEDRQDAIDAAMDTIEDD